MIAWSIWLHGSLAVIYLALMMYAADVLRIVHRAHNLLVYGYVRLFLLMSALLCGTFAVIQAAWIYAEGYNYWPEPLAGAWLIFDSVNALAYALFISATRVFLLWEPSGCIDAPTDCPRRKDGSSS